MYARYLLIVFMSLTFGVRAQCPQIYNYLGALSSRPYFISCTGGSFAVNFQSNSSWGAYSINWGDGTTNTVGLSYTANNILTHNYAQTIDTFQVILTIPSSACTMTGIVVMEKPVNASIQIPTLGITTACAPKTLTFTNASTDVSATTTFTWDFGDGSTNAVYSYTNSGQSVMHPYLKNTVNCQTQVTLRAKNYCSFGNPTIANFNPIQIYDVDDAQITPDKLVRCWPDNAFTFSNTTTRNCLAQGNTPQRREKWNFGNYWGLGHDSLIGWTNWPPTSARTIAYPSIGTYTAMLRDSNQCGVDTAFITVSIVNAPIAALVTPTTPICQNIPVTFTNNSSAGYPVKWNFGTGSGFQSLGSGNRTFTYTTPGTYTVKLVSLIPNAGGACQDTATAVINVNASPTASFAFAPTLGCNSLTTTFTNQSVGATAFVWNLGNSSTSTLTTPAAQAYTTAGISTVTLVATNTLGCFSQITKTLLIRPNPVPAFTQFSICVGLPATFTNQSTVTGTNPIINYVWNLGNSITSSSTNPQTTYTAAGNYTVKLKASTAFCSDSINQVVNVGLKPTVAFALTPTAGCTVLQTNATNTSSNASSYLWHDHLGITTSALAQPVLSFTNTTQAVANRTITLIAFSANGCSDSLKKTIAIQPRPVASFTTSQSVGCSPLAIQFSNTAIGANAYAWTFGDGTFSASANPIKTYTNNSLFTQTVSAQLIASNSFGCNDTAKSMLTIYAAALPNFSMNPPAGCSPLKVNFPAVPGVAIYAWSHGNASPVFTTTTSHDYTFTNSTASTMVVPVTLTAQTSNGCIGTASKQMTVYSLPVVQFTPSTNAGCPPLNIQFNNGSSPASSSYVWTYSASSTGTTLNGNYTFTANPGAATSTTTVKLVATTTNNCKDSVSQPIVIYALPKAAFTADTPGCSPKLVTFSNKSSGASTYKWQFLDNTNATSTLFNATHLFTNNGASEQQYAVKLTATNDNGCRDSSNMILTIYGKPVFNIVSQPDSGCSPLPVRFSQIQGATDIKWSYNGIAFGTNGAFTNNFTSSSITNYTIQSIITDKHGCKDTALKRIKVYPTPVANFVAFPTTISIPNEPVITENRSTGATSYNWNFGDGFTSTLTAPSHKYTKTGTFDIRLIVTNTKGCKDTMLVPGIIALEQALIKIPNAFTPNTSGSPGTIYNPNDLSNDIFHPVLQGVDTYQMSIFNRWGELIFETNNPNEGWDGYYKGQLCIQDTYIYKIVVSFTDGQRMTKTGDVLLLR